MPVLPTVAMDVDVLDHVPPMLVELSAEVLPGQSTLLPVIGFTEVTTATTGIPVMALAQPVALFTA